MRLRSLYLLASLVLGGLAALAVALQVFALGAGVSWLYLFGDDPWPARAESVLVGASLAAGLATLGASLAFGYLHGRRCESAPRPERARRRGRALLLGGLALWLLVAGLGLWQQERQSSARAAAAVQEAAFVDLLQARHVITDIALADSDAAALRLSLALAGARRGAYRLAWQLSDPLYGVTLLSGEQHLALGPEAASADLGFEIAVLAERYRETVLQGRSDKVLVDGIFRLQLSLEPLLDDEERRDLPAREIGNLERGLSDLRFETQVEVPVALDLTGP
jgi:F0F1-type ATP synthase membrane subunit c/vacuolar-type H+-ATPase subunit K